MQETHGLQSLMEACEGAYSPSTLKGYTCDLRCFARWCEDRLADWLPADARTVAEFIDDQIPMHRLATIKRRVVAIAFAHRMLDLPNPVEHSAVRLALRRARRTKPQRPEQYAGLTYELLAKVLALDCKTISAYRDTALVAVASFCAAGWSNLVAWPTDYRTSTFWDGMGWDLPAHMENLNAGIKVWLGLLAYRLGGRLERVNPGGCLSNDAISRAS